MLLGSRLASLLARLRAPFRITPALGRSRCRLGPFSRLRLSRAARCRFGRSGPGGRLLVSLALLLLLLLLIPLLFLLLLIPLLVLLLLGSLLLLIALLVLLLFLSRFGWRALVCSFVRGCRIGSLRGLVIALVSGRLVIAIVCRSRFGVSSVTRRLIPRLLLLAEIGRHTMGSRCRLRFRWA